jgi:integrase
MGKFVKPIPFPITRPEIYELGKKLLNEEQRALFYTLYLTGARVSEVLQIPRRDARKDMVNGVPGYVFEVVTSKSRSLFPRRPLGFPSKGYEGKMADAAWEYIDRITDPSQKIFHFSRTRAAHILEKLVVHTRAIAPSNEYLEIDLKIHPHYLRHCRATHFAVYHGWSNPYDYMKWFGWSDPKRPLTYIQQKWQDLFLKFNMLEEPEPIL